MSHDYTRGPLTSGPRGNFTRHSGPVHTVVVHYTWAERSSMAQVAQWHAQRSFNGPGYHYLIRLDGTLEYGRPEWARGAHTRGHNDRSIGIAYEGGRIAGCNVGLDTRTKEQKAAMAALVHELKGRYLEVSRVVGHRDLTPTQCPGFDVAAWWEGRNAAPAPAGVPPADPDAIDARTVNPIIAALRALAALFTRGRS